jgi:hypothetical protein
VVTSYRLNHCLNNFIQLVGEFPRLGNHLKNSTQSLSTSTWFNSTTSVSGRLFIRAPIALQHFSWPLHYFLGPLVPPWPSILSPGCGWTSHGSSECAPPIMVPPSWSLPWPFSWFLQVWPSIMVPPLAFLVVPPRLFMVPHWPLLMVPHRPLLMVPHWLFMVLPWLLPVSCSLVSPCCSLYCLVVLHIYIA